MISLKALRFAHKFCMMGGCLACGVKPEMRAFSDKHSKELVNQGRTERLPSISGEFWPKSACDMDNSAVQSQGSMSSISTSVQVLDPHRGVGNTNPSSEFVNHGFLLWCQTRQHWVGNKKSVDQGEQAQEPKLRKQEGWFQDWSLLNILLERVLRKLTWEQQTISSTDPTL